MLHCHGTDLFGLLDEQFKKESKDLTRWKTIIEGNIKSARTVLVSTPEMLTLAKQIRRDAEYLPNPVDVKRFSPKTIEQKEVRAIGFDSWYEKVPKEIINFLEKNNVKVDVYDRRPFSYLEFQKTLTKYGIELSQLFEGKKNVIETILNIYSDNKNNFDDEIKTIKEAYESLVDKYSSIDKSMSGNVQSKSKQTIKSIVELEKKYKKAQKSSNAKLIQDIDNLYGSLFGNNSSQERYDNFLNYYASDETFIATLVDILNPLVLNYKIIKL